MLKSVTFRTTLVALACAISFSANAMADGPKKVDVPAGDLIAALQKLAEQSGVEFIYSVDQLKPFHTNGVKGDYEPKDAIRLLIKGTPLELRAEPSGAILIALPRTNASAIPSSSSTGAQNTDAKEGKKSSSSGFRVARVDQGTNPQSPTVGSSSSVPEGNSKDIMLEEIVVTAQKREERLQDVPVPVTALDTGPLIQTHQLRLEDYYTKVPGLSISLLAPDGAPSIAIRGLTTGGATNPTTGIVIDDVPYGSTVTVGNVLPLPDIDPNDVRQIEVLRGPQGTFYGASSIGGLLKIATIDPSTDAVTGRVQLGTNGVKNGDGAGYEVRGSVNVPLGTTFAVRASGFVQQDPGYIDNVRTGEDGINERRSKGGRLAALWKPSDDLSLKLSALIQDAKRRGSDNVDFLPGLGDLQQNEMPGTGGYDRKSQAYAATLKAKLGTADLTSATGYSKDRMLNSQDVSSTPNFGPAASRLYHVAGAVDLGENTTDKFSQELRLEMPLTSMLDWLVGGFYTHEKSLEAAQFAALDPATGSTVGNIAISESPDIKFEEYAAFTDLTVHFTDRFDVQFGGRYSHNQLTYFSVRGGPLLGNVTTTSPVYSSQGSPVTYLVTPRLKFSQDLMVYARIASGYRPGIPNVNCGLADVPCQSNADKTLNYEVGMKGNVLDKLLSFDTSIYYIDWKDVQLPLTNAQHFGYTANAGRAKSQGVELSLQSRPLTGLTLALWTAWNDAVLTEDIPALANIYGRSGDRLPYGSRFSGNFSIDQEFELTERLTGFVGADVSYVGDRKGVFRGTTTVSGAALPLPRQGYPAYAQVDARAGAKLDTFTVTAFVNNITDKRGLIGGDVANFIPFAYNYIQPRMFGVSLTKTFR